MPKKKSNRGGPRVAGPGKRIGRPKTEDPKSFPRSIRISQAVNEYLTDVGSGIIDDVIRKTKGFKDWVKQRQAKD